MLVGITIALEAVVIRGRNPLSRVSASGCLCGAEGDRKPTVSRRQFVQSEELTAPSRKSAKDGER